MYETIKINTIISKGYDWSITSIEILLCIHESSITLFYVELLSGLVGNILFINWFFYLYTPRFDFLNIKFTHALQKRYTNCQDYMALFSITVALSVWLSKWFWWLASGASQIKDIEHDGLHVNIGLDKNPAPPLMQLTCENYWEYCAVVGKVAFVNYITTHWQHWSSDMQSRKLYCVATKNKEAKLRTDLLNEYASWIMYLL